VLAIPTHTYLYVTLIHKQFKPRADGGDCSKGVISTMRVVARKWKDLTVSIVIEPDSSVPVYSVLANSTVVSKVNAYINIDHILYLNKHDI